MAASVFYIKHVFIFLSLRNLENIVSDKRSQEFDVLEKFVHRVTLVFRKIRRFRCLLVLF